MPEHQFKDENLNIDQLKTRKRLARYFQLTAKIAIDCPILGFPQSVTGIPMIMPTYDSKLRQDIDHWAKLHDVELNMIIESQDISVKKIIALDGIGIIPTATHTVQKQLKNGELIEIGKLDGVYEELHLITAQRKIANYLATKLRDTFSL